MSVLSQLKRLWELGNYEIQEDASTNEPVLVRVDRKPKGMATVVPDDPIDLFPPENNEKEPHDNTRE